MIIRKEEQKDYFTVENLVREAFWNVYRPGCMEHFVVHKLREDKCCVRDLTRLAEVDGETVAAIFYSEGTLLRANGTTEKMLTFGPVAVKPSFQKQGIGEFLIRTTMDNAAKLGYPCLVITGNPQYYAKYGFAPSSDFGIRYCGMDESDAAPFFMCKRLDEKAEIPSGVYSDPSCFDTDEAEVDTFDKLFPPMVKEKRPGQLC